MLDIRIEGAAELRRLSRQLRTVGDGKAIRRDLTRGLRQGVKPAVDAAKRAALALPDEPGGRSTNFRRKTARAIAPQVRTAGRDPQVAVRISRRRMGEQASLVRATNDGRWRHPVFGDRNTWVTQYSRRGWFDDAVSSRGPSVRRELERVLDDIERRLARS